MTQTIADLSARQVRDLVRKGDVSATEAVQSVLERIGQRNPALNAYIRVHGAEALRRSAQLDSVPVPSRTGALWGVPIANKDVICVHGTETTCASRILKGFIAPYSATVIRRLEDEGAIIVGNTNMDEFAMGSSTENSALAVTRNPWDPERTPGGSSGGSAAAVAGGLAVAALGSDTGGSIRQPAASCGCVGLKPTYGRVSRYGLVAFASSLDQIGPLTKNVEDAALIARVMSGPDPLDSTSVDCPVQDYPEELKRGVSGLRIGLPKEYFIEGLDPEVKLRIEEGIKVFQDLGVRIVECSLPHTEYAVATYYILATAEASSNLARYDGIQYGHRAGSFENLRDLYFQTRAEGFGSEVKRRIILGSYVLSSGYYDAYYLKAQKVRTLIKRDFEEAFRVCDALITPTSPTCAFRLGEKLDDPLQMYLSDIFTISANLAGLPGISIPCGFSRAGLPVGLQILGKHFDESAILRLAYAFECSTDHHAKRPELSWIMKS